MSAKIMGKVWDLELPHNKLLVLLALADHADHDGNNVYPSIDLVSWKTGYGEDQTRRIMAALRKDGILVEVERKPGRVVKYRINLDAGTLKTPRTAMQPPAKSHPLQDATPYPPQNDTSTPRTAMQPEPSLTINKEPSNNAPSGAKGSMFGFRTSPANAAYWTEHTAALNYLRAAIGIDASMCPLPTSASELTNVIGAHQDLHRAGLVSALAIANYVAWLQAKYTLGLHWSQIRGQISVYLSQQENQLPNGKPKVTAKDILGTTVIIK